jgi:hypothetical protein
MTKRRRNIDAAGNGGHREKPTQSRRCTQRRDAHDRGVPGGCWRREPKLRPTPLAAVGTSDNQHELGDARNAESWMGVVSGRRTSQARSSSITTYRRQGRLRAQAQT